MLLTLRVVGLVAHRFHSAVDAEPGRGIHDRLDRIDVS
jgi:hypothetical protein